MDKEKINEEWKNLAKKYFEPYAQELNFDERDWEVFLNRMDTIFYFRMQETADKIVELLNAIREKFNDFEETPNSYEDFVKKNYFEIVCPSCHTKQLLNKNQAYLWDVIRKIKDAYYNGDVSFYVGNCLSCGHLIKVPLKQITY